MYGDKITSQDISQKQEINRFSEDSQKLLEDMNQTEIFELCENSVKYQCPDCNAFCEIGIIYCSCGRNLKYSRSPTTLRKTNCDFTSTPGFVTKKNSSRGPKHGVSERQVMFHKRRNRCLRNQDKANMAAIRRYFRGGTNKEHTECLWWSTILAKKKSCFSIASLLKDTTIRLRELSGCRTPNIGFFV